MRYAELKEYLFWSNIKGNDNQEYTIVGGRIKSPTASLEKILKDANVYKIIASTANCYELSNDLFLKREQVE